MFRVMYRPRGCHDYRWSPALTSQGEAEGLAARLQAEEGFARVVDWQASHEAFIQSEKSAPPRHLNDLQRSWWLYHRDIAAGR
jgi:hypothetical protein